MFVIFGLLGVLLLYLLLKFLGASVSLIKKLVVNGISGLVLLMIFNFVGGLADLNVDINVVNSLVAGFFGVPGVIILLLID